MRCNCVLIFWGRHVSMVPVMIPRHPLLDPSVIELRHPKSGKIDVFKLPNKVDKTAAGNIPIFLLLWNSKWFSALILSFHLLLSMTTSVRPRLSVLPRFDCWEESGVAAFNQMVPSVWYICSQISHICHYSGLNDQFLDSKGTKNDEMLHTSYLAG